MILVVRGILVVPSARFYVYRSATVQFFSIHSGEKKKNSKITALLNLVNPSLKNIRYIRLCSLVLTIKHAVRFSTGGKTLIGLSVHSLRFSRLSSSPRARAAFSSSPLRKSRENNSAEEKKRKKRGEEEEEEEEEEAFFSFLRAHFYCLKYPRLHLNASARAS